MRHSKICLHCAFYASADLFCLRWQELTRPENPAPDCFTARSRQHKSPRGRGRLTGGKSKTRNKPDNATTATAKQIVYAGAKNSLTAAAYRRHTFERAENPLGRLARALNLAFFMAFAYGKIATFLRHNAGYGRNTIAAMRIGPPFLAVFSTRLFLRPLEIAN